MVFIPKFRKNLIEPVSKKNEFISNVVQPEVETKPKKIVRGSGFAEVETKTNSSIPLAISKKISDEKLKKFINLRL